MSLISKLFRNEKSPSVAKTTDEYTSIISFNEKLDSLLSSDRYISRKDYCPLAEEYHELFTFFSNLKKGEMLVPYCKIHALDINQVEKFLSAYPDLRKVKKGSSAVNRHNEDFIRRHLSSDKEYLDHILDKVDPAIRLDEEQRKAVLCDEDNMLVIAGAGAGKTTTVAAKVKYLVDKRGVDPKEILVISYTNKAVGELRERINSSLGIDCPVTTFHKTGYTIIKKQDDEKRTVVDGGFLYNTVNDYLKNSILEQPDMVDKTVLLFGSYFDAPYEGDDLNGFFNYVSKADFSSMKGNVGEFMQEIVDRRSGRHVTITNEFLRSAQEVRIANFLYLNNIDYTYEKPYPYHILRSSKPYTPDFTIRQGDKVAYIEHFGISEDGKNSRYDAKQLGRYKTAVNDKVSLHRKHKTDLIYTFSSYNDGRDFIEHLRDQLQSKGFVIEPRPSQEVYQKIISTEENKYIMRLVKLLCTFISNFKTNGYAAEDFLRFDRESSNVRTKLFLEICMQCYLEYSKKLKEIGAIDFEDMINDSARILREQEDMGNKLSFKYIIVDEYQDISRQRFDLTKELSKICDAKIIAVGDDWQSIYAYAGSDIALFTGFSEKMGYAELLKITKTYRNAQQVIDIAGGFIQKNNTQISKSLISPKSIDEPVIIHSYDESVPKKDTLGKGGRYYLLGKKVEEVIGLILEKNREEGKPVNSSILLLGRYSFDARNLCFSNDFVYDEKNNKVISKKYPRANLEYLTAHRSKGLGYDNVVIVNARDEMYGFPSQIDDDPIMKLVTRDDTSIEYAEERRLFYVALTRTKNRVHIVTPIQRPSKFVLELIDDYPGVVLRGEVDRNHTKDLSNMKRCPVCHYPLQLRYKKNYGLRLWICTNEPEMCDFMTNDPAGGGLPVLKCDCCRTGYLIVKRSKDGKKTFLGCTNYKEDGTGCNNMVWPENTGQYTSKGFTEDPSLDKPVYEKEYPKEEKLPVLSGQYAGPAPDSNKGKVNELVKKGDVHKTGTAQSSHGKKRYNVIVDDEGEMITDFELLKHLAKIRSEIAERDQIPESRVLLDNALVSISTYPPTTKEDFVGLWGISETAYSKYGEVFLREIQDFYLKKAEKDSSGAM
ncbi:MAG: UvrD-helicase domain-containing protein [Bacteroidales bacterium]|nr:UvrD-helicase domain-containing protein [Bacteroidales bacterium]